ncbi:MAG: primosomal protein N' [Lachnospiraceae bacterium]|nr:primosomal protein N' [Lachnospiraceae bacterium]
MEKQQENRYAQVIIDISHESVDRMFTYKVPDALLGQLSVGDCVSVPFGKGNTLRSAYITGFSDTVEFDPAKIKQISGRGENLLPARARNIALAAWMKERYGSTMIMALGTVLTVKKKVKPVIYKEVSLLVSEEEAAALKREAFLKHQSAKVRLFGALMGTKSVSYRTLTGELSVSPATIKSLEKQGILKIESFENYRNPIRFSDSGREKKELTLRQRQIADDYLRRYDQGERKTALLFGITGSGKTEVYMEIIDGILRRGKQVIVLIPEIALTHQTVRRFYRRFGDVIAIMNSRLSAGEKYDQLQRVEKGEVQIMIGPRSAVFTPFDNLGLILIDEEHENGYKSETMPRFHAREVAQKLCELTGAGLFLGSATPSLESYYRAKNGEYTLYELKERIGEAKLPEVSVVDLRKELAAGNFSMFSARLRDAMERRLARGEQIMLFLNRRGMAGFLSCKSCGEVIKCPNCDVSLSDHKTKMICHYCGYEAKKPRLCPSCGSHYLYGFKAGTQQVEEELLKMYPRARVLRMDADTTAKKEDYDKILTSFRDREADILVGTQMIVKGHDFPYVTLVGVLAADLSLFDSDYTASERTFQLLTQAVGRSGRAQRPGEALIQTYRPDHFAVMMAAKQDYEGFYEEEIADRQLCGFPPVTHLLAVLMTGEDEEKLKSFASWLVSGLPGMFEEKNRPLMLGPAPASIGRIRNRYRQVVYIKSNRQEDLIRAKDLLEEKVARIKKAAEPFMIYFDFDPMNGY